MKKILSLVLLVAMLALALVGCGNKDNGPDNTPSEKEYTLSIAVDNAAKGAKITNTAVALVIDADGKIVACRLDCAEVSVKLDGEEIATVDRVTTKVELGDAYTGMPAGSFEQQAKAFEQYVIGKTAAEIEALDLALVTGCTMASTGPVFKSIIAKAFAYERKVSFKTTGTITLGLAIDSALKGSVADGNVTVSADFAAAALVDGKVVAGIIDSNERKAAVAVETVDDTATLTVTPADYAGSKNEQGDAYDAYQPMPAGRWYQQAQAFANTAVGKTAAEVAELTVDKDALTQVGCSIYAGGYKAALVRAVGYAR